MEEKQVLIKAPGWLKDTGNVSVAAAIMALLFVWGWNGEAKNIPNLREYLKKEFDDMSDDEIAEIGDLLIEHKVVKEE